MTAIIAITLLGIAISTPTLAYTPRSKAAVAEFKRLNPCPANGARRGPCPNWIIDHIVPLDCGGADAPTNMQWQTNADAKVKDRIERRNCQRH